MPSAPEKAKRPLAPLKPIDENMPASDDVQPMEISDEENRKIPQESFPLFPAEYGPNGPAFNEQLHVSKLAFFGTSPYIGERTSLSPRFWTKEQAVYYARILFGKNRIFNHKILNFAELEEMPRFLHSIEHIEHALLKGFMRFNHGWNREIILQFYATLYISGELGNTSSWTLEWMTGRERIKCLADQFLAMINLPRCEFEKDREHRCITGEYPKHNSTC
jgi:hypothetical protein